MKTTLAHRSEAKKSRWQPPTHPHVRQHTSHSSCTGCGTCRKITSSTTNASASLMLKSLEPGKKVCATRFLQRTYGNRYVQRMVQSKKMSDNTPEVTPSLESDIQSLKGGGQPLSKLDHTFFKSHFRHNFSQIRVHKDTRAAEIARSVNAREFTIDKEVVFGAGQYAQVTMDGKQLLAHEMVNSIQQRTQSDNIVKSLSDQGKIISNTWIQRKGESVEEKCTKTYKQAKSFQELVDLVRAAEDQLIACGHSDIEDRIKILRGIYYGTTWSLDYSIEKSSVRNLGFNRYTDPIGGAQPLDPRGCLKCNLFDAIFKSAEVSDGSRRVDFGHLIIGMDARESFVSREMNILLHGGTGLDVTTWLGDLGGGAGMLSIKRVSNPKQSVSTVFSGSNFGGAVNLEGDIAAFLVARDTSEKDDPSPPKIPKGGYIADALKAYLEPGGAGVEWNSRCKNFLLMIGGNINKSGTLTNRNALVQKLSQQIEAFGAWYMVNRLRQSGRLKKHTLLTASSHLHGTSNEVAEVFVGILANCLGNPNGQLRAKKYPTPTPRGSESEFFRKVIEASEGVKGITDEGKKLIDDAGKWLDNLL